MPTERLPFSPAFTAIFVLEVGICAEICADAPRSFAEADMVVFDVGVSTETVIDTHVAASYFVKEPQPASPVGSRPFIGSFATYA